MNFPFVKGLTHRNGEPSSKKFWYNIAALVASIVIIWEGYKLPTVDGMDDWSFIWLFAIYLITVGGFEVILEMMRLAITWKTGGKVEEEPKDDRPN